MRNPLRRGWGQPLDVGPKSEPPGTPFVPMFILPSGASFERAQIGTRPVQRTPPPATGQATRQQAGLRRAGQTYERYAGLEHGAETFHIAAFFRSANRGYVSPTENGYPSSGDNSTVIKKGLQRFPTRGARSIGGAASTLGGRYFDDAGRAPAVFVPAAPLR